MVPGKAVDFKQSRISKIFWNDMEVILGQIRLIIKRTVFENDTQDSFNYYSARLAYLNLSFGECHPRNKYKARRKKRFGLAFTAITDFRRTSMAVVSSIRIDNLFILTPQMNWQGQLTLASISTSHQDVSFSSCFLGDNTEKDRAMDFTDKFDHPAMVVKWWTNQDKTVLKAVAVFSKYRVPFKLEIESYPPSDPTVNQKYLTALKEGVDRVYTLLRENPTEFPMISAEQVRKTLGPLRIQPFKNGDVDFRSEIHDRKENPQARGSF